MNRYRASLAPCSAFQLPSLAHLESVLCVGMESKSAVGRSSSFPRRERDGTYQLQPSDIEQLHDIFLKDFVVYRRILREFERATRGNPAHAANLGAAINTWKPWLMNYEESKQWKRQNGQLTLPDALRAFRISCCKIIYTGVRHAGSKRTGSSIVLPSSEHRHVYSMFQYCDELPIRWVVSCLCSESTFLFAFLVRG